MFWRTWGRKNCDNYFRRLPRTLVIVDLPYLLEKEHVTLTKLVERKAVAELSARALSAACRKASSPKLLVKRGQGADWTDAEFALDLSPACVLSIRPFKYRQALVCRSVTLPEESRFLYENKLGIVQSFDAGGLFSWMIVENSRPLAVACHGCSGRGYLKCDRCAGTGSVKSRRGNRYTCSRDGCRRGRICCYYCKGSKHISCALFDEEDGFWLTLPKALRHDLALPIYVQGIKLRPESIRLLPLAAELARSRRQPAAKDDYLRDAEEKFGLTLTEMEAALQAEIEASAGELETVRAANGRILQSGSRETILCYETEDALPEALKPGRELYFFRDLACAPLSVFFLGVENRSIHLRVKHRRKETLHFAREGLLISVATLKTIKVQREALEMWDKRDILKSRIKFALCLPEQAEHGVADAAVNVSNPAIAANPAQLDALQKAAAGNTALICIQGPPGTGKTSVICEIIRQELARRGGKILVSSQSNLAVDNILERLTGVPGIGLLRLGEEERVAPPMRKYLEKNLLAAPGAGGFLALLQRLVFRGAARSTAHTRLGKVNVIGATCIGSSHPLVREAAQAPDAANRISLVILDEAGRSTVAESLVPLQYAERAVIVGDQRQLPPMVTTEVKEIWSRRHEGGDFEENAASKSIMEYLFPRLPQGCKTVLRRQFRMHPQLGAFIGGCFYPDEHLENGAPAAERSCPLPHLPAALSYHSTKGYGEARYDRQAGSSKVNQAEIDVITRLMAWIERELKTGGISCGVISFYAAQAELLRQKLSTCSFSRLLFDARSDVATLDSFQGREKDLIILSLVRCPRRLRHSESLNFMLDLRRLNVALSRARCRLFIVGDIEQLLMIEQGEDKSRGLAVLQQLHDYITRNNCTVDPSFLTGSN